MRIPYRTWCCRQLLKTAGTAGAIFVMAACAAVASAQQGRSTDLSGRAEREMKSKAARLGQRLKTETVPAARVEMDPAYLPMEAAPFFNANEPRIIPDASEQSRLKFQSPPWLRQVLDFPAQSEIRRCVGLARADTRRLAVESIQQIVNPQALDADTARHLIPMRGWAVLYEDWHSHGGTDAFLTKFKSSDRVMLVMETHNHVIVLARNLGETRIGDFAGILRLVYRYADTLLNEHFKPLSVDGLKIFRTNLNPLCLYGFYTPKIEALTGAADTRDLLTTGGVPNETSTGARASAVRFFTNGDFAAFMVLKPVFGAELRNPFEPRFTGPAWSDLQERPFWDAAPAQSRAARLPVSEQTKRRQIEEFLGTYFLDADGTKLTQRISIEDLDKAFTELSPQQKLAIVERKMVDEFHTSGTRAFVDQNYESAIHYWTQILAYDPENPRPAILIAIAIREYARSKYGGSVEKARVSDRVVSQAVDALTRQQTLLALSEVRDEQQQVKERAVVDFRTRALNFLSEGNYEASLKEWDKLLNVDPGNASALVFREICETKLKPAASGKP